MQTIETLVLVLLVAVLSILIYVFFVRKEKEKKEDSQGMILLQQQLQELTRTMDQKIGEGNKAIQHSVSTQLSESTKIVKEVTEGLTKLGETNKQVISFAEQLKQLQDVLKNPKQRGILGEYYLETVLQNVLPPNSFQMQYGFENGEIVDAVVFVKDKIVPIDSKFSLENYNRYIEAQDPIEKLKYEKDLEKDLKLRIKETSKYIRPNEKTTDFAFMFIPSEGIYYELLSRGVGDENLIQLAAGKYKVIIVSPTSFLAYLQTVLQGLKALEIEDKALDIIKNVEKLGTHISKYEKYYQKLGSTLGTTINHYNAGYKELGKIDKDVTRITGDSVGINSIELDKPHKEDD